MLNNPLLYTDPSGHDPLKQWFADNPNVSDIAIQIELYELVCGRLDDEARATISASKNIDARNEVLGRIT